MKKLVCIIGCFGFGYNLLNGQTIKTKILLDELRHEYGDSKVSFIDTWGRINHLLLIPKLFKALWTCNHLIILPGRNGIKMIIPILDLMNKLFSRSLHYDVIGGWLSQSLSENRYLIPPLKKYKGIYVETNVMRTDLLSMGLDNIKVVPNCKELSIINEKDLLNRKDNICKYATFSRVMKEKGIEYAVNAIVAANDRLGERIFYLDIYGPVEHGQEEWFENLMSRVDKEIIRYRGIVPFDTSISFLRNYYGLLFPTFYSGEGFAGTIIDAYAAGLPVIASDWKYNAEVIQNHITGIIVPIRDVQSIADALIWSYNHKVEWHNYRKNCVRIAHLYLPQNALRIIKDNID